MESPFKIEFVLSVARKHPFYSSNLYPLTPEQIAAMKGNMDISTTARKPSFLEKVQKWRGVSLSAPLTISAASDTCSLLSEFPIKAKEDLYETMTRLCADEDSRNTFRRSTSISITGGGGGNTANPLAFFTDVQENRAQRAACGALMRRCGILSDADCVLSMHTTGKLYRALDLTKDVVEYAGASVLPAGHLATPEELLTICKNFKPNVLSGDSSQLVAFATYVEGTEARDFLKIDKILYTSEVMTRSQRLYLESIFGRSGTPLTSTSALASAEMGIWAVSKFGLTGTPREDSAEFIFDSRHMIVEVLPLDFEFSPTTRNTPCRLQLDEVGVLVVTSLQRLRNPLVRYLNGDVGSVHMLPESAVALIEGDTEYLRVLRLYGRNLRHSFEWQGEYIEFAGFQKLMRTPSWAILRWQIVMSNHPTAIHVHYLEIKLARKASEEDCETYTPQEVLEARLREYLDVHEMSEDFFKISIVGAEDFVRSETGKKVIMFVDKRT